MEFFLDIQQAKRVIGADFVHTIRNEPLQSERKRWKNAAPQIKKDSMKKKPSTSKQKQNKNTKNTLNKT